MPEFIEPLHPDTVLKAIAFKDVPIGSEFWWGSISPARCNWGRKRSSRTADWRPMLANGISDYTRWSYWRSNDTVFLVA